MRKVTQLVVGAFIERKPKSLSNTVSTGDALYLFGNKIAEWRGTDLWITSAHYPTVTTKERLNGLPNVNISQSNYLWYLNGKEWRGEWTKV